MGRISYLVGAWLGLTVCLFGQAKSETNELSRLRALYESGVKKVLDDGNAKLRSWPEDYVKDVTELRVKTQKSGDLDGLMAVDAELKRFMAAKSFPDEVLASAPEAIRTIQLAYRDKPKQIVLERDQKVMEFVGLYKDRLEAMQSSLTKGNNIAEAMLVNAEIKRVASTPAVTSAEFTMAEEDARKKSLAAAVTPPPVVPPSDDSPPVPDPVRPRKSKDIVPRPVVPPVPPPVDPSGVKKPERLAPGFKLVEKSSGLGTPMKPLPMTVTAQLRMPKVRVDVVMDEREPSDSSAGGDGYGGSYRYRSGNTKLVFRASVRATTATNEYDNAKMVLQYFTRTVTARVGGKIDPDEALRIETPLPHVSSQAVTLECPPFQFWSTTSKYRSLYSSSNYKYGDDFYGAVISVFDSDGKMLFQGASMNSLEKLGVASP